MIHPLENTVGEVVDKMPTGVYERQYPGRASRLDKLATSSGQTVDEYLIEHPEYKMSLREMQKWGNKVLKLAERRLKEARSA